MAPPTLLGLLGKARATLSKVAMEKSRRDDDKRDGEDAPELAVRVNEEPKPKVLRRLVGKAREAMESAAQRREQPLPWV